MCRRRSSARSLELSTQITRAFSAVMSASTARGKLDEVAPQFKSDGSKSSQAFFH
jgi:hypothetical protein